MCYTLCDLAHYTAFLILCEQCVVDASKVNMKLHHCVSVNKRLLRVLLSKLETVSKLLKYLMN